jgi:hypothetical protein
MAARGAKKGADHPVMTQAGVFCCSGCGSALQLEQVGAADAERANGTITGYILIDHACSCAEGSRTSRCWGSYPAFLALFGKMPHLPFRSPFAFHRVAADDPVVARWRWELGQVAGWQEFMLFLDDALERRNAA